MIELVTMLFDARILPVTFPILAGVLCFLVPKRFDRVAAVLAIVGSAMSALIAWLIFAQVRTIAMGESVDLSICACISMKVDHLSSFVMLAITVFGFLVSLYSMGYMSGKERLTEYYAWLLWTIGLSCGAVLANELILLLIFWGLLGVALYMMIGMGGPDASTAAKKSFIIIGGTDCFLMLGIALVWLLTGTTSMDDIWLNVNTKLGFVAFLCFTIAALAKAGGMPVHSWVPDCGEKAPVSVTALLPASIDKLLGIYLLTRVSWDLFEMNVVTNTLLMAIGAGTIICAVMMALVQHDLKRLLSYHAVSQVGYMVLGIGTGTLVGIAGGLFHMLNNVVYKTCLFMCAGSVEKQAGSTDLDKLGGLAKLMPLTFGTCVVAVLAISGVPPLNGFASKWMVYQGIVELNKNGNTLWVIWLAAAMLGSALTLASFVKVLHAVFLRKPSLELAGKQIKESAPSMILPMVFLAALCVLFGVFAARIPLAGFIFPILPKVIFTGKWLAGPATVMLLVAYLLGLFIYRLTTARKVRKCDTYIGGELLDSTTYVSGMASDPAKDLEVTGIDFYETVQNIPPLNMFYAMAKEKLFDLYEVGKSIVGGFGVVLSFMHSGSLQRYLGWCLLGGAILLFIWLV